MLGGAMRQSGIIAAGGLYALKHNMPHLSQDQQNAKLIAEQLVQLPDVQIDLANVKTNIVVLKLTQNAPTAFTVVQACQERDVAILAFSERTIRLVTHLQVDSGACQRAADIIAEALSAAK